MMPNKRWREMFLSHEGFWRLERAVVYAFICAPLKNDSLCGEVLDKKRRRKEVINIGLSKHNWDKESILQEMRGTQGKLIRAKMKVNVCKWMESTWVMGRNVP